MFDHPLYHSIDAEGDQFYVIEGARPGHLGGDKYLFYRHLTQPAIVFLKNTRRCQVAHLVLVYGLFQSWDVREDTRTKVEVICNFIPAFNTLTSLKLKHFQSPATLSIYAVSGDTLRVLKCSQGGINGKAQVPYQSARTVTTITENLPQLRELDFSPQKWEIVGIFHV